ncbi:MAG: 30S ribosomal protein S3 [archaeon]|nr:30S ribosomal protein S3 [archaeon]
MEERKIVQLKKDEFAIKEYIKNSLGKGKVSKVKIDYTPIGEKIIVSTNKPGLVIGKRGEKIEELTRVLKNRFKLENPHIEIDEIIKPEFDSQLIADEIAISLERLGPLKFKVIAYKALQRIMEAGALGVEIRLSGKLPSARAKNWRFAQGYLKKVGDTAKVVDRAQSVAQTKPGTVGIKVSILPPDAYIHDKIIIDEVLMGKLRMNDFNLDEAKENQKLKIKSKSKKKEKVVESKEIQNEKN